MSVEIVAPPNVRLSWSCKRCGHTGGWAETKFPVEPYQGSAMWEVMKAELRKFLVRKHLKQGCVAIPDDFVIGPYRP